MERDNRSYTDVFVVGHSILGPQIEHCKHLQRADSTEGTKCPNKTQEPSKVIQPAICVLGEVVKFSVYGRAQGKASCTFYPLLEVPVDGHFCRCFPSALSWNQELIVSDVVELTWLHRCCISRFSKGFAEWGLKRR